MDDTREDQEKLTELQKKILNRDINKGLRKLRENYRKKQDEDSASLNQKQ